MSHTYADIADYVTAGKTPAEIATLLSDDPRHVRDIPIRDMRNYLMNTVELLTVTPGNVWAGDLRDHVMATGSDTLIKGLSQLIANIATDSAQHISVHSDPRVASLGSALISLAIANNTPERGAIIRDEFYKLSGGPLYGPTTEAEVQATIDEEEARVAAEAAQAALDELRSTIWQTWKDVYNPNIAPILDGTDPSVPNLIAGVQAALVALEGV